LYFKCTANEAECISLIYPIMSISSFLTSTLVCFKANTIGHGSSKWGSGYICNHGYSDTPCELGYNGIIGLILHNIKYAVNLFRIYILV